MKPRSQWLKPISVLALIVCLTACKKDKEDPTDEQLPTLATCKSVTPTSGVSGPDAAGNFTLRTSGGGKIIVNHELYITISYDSYPDNFSLELWGTVDINGKNKNAGTHENLNGKHIKDRLGAVRTIIFPDGAKLTVVAEGVYERIVSVTLFDGDKVHHINTICNILEYSGSSAKVAQWLDAEQPDGEAGGFEITATGLIFYNSYTEDVKGNKVIERQNLGGLEKGKPNLINDYYDDPRIGHT